MHIRPVDERGWLVPEVSTKFREVYTMLRHGFKPREMLPLLAGTKIGSIRQMVFRIKNPRRLPSHKRRPKWIMITQAEHSPPAQLV